MQIGYALISANKQDEAAQAAALRSAGCELIFQDKAGGGRWKRPELHRLLGQLRKKDVVVVWKLDRLSRSLKDLLVIMERIDQAGAGFKSLMESIDTTTPAGRMMMQMVGSFAEFEREILRERGKAGLDAARREGRVGGRPPILSENQQKDIIENILSGRKTGGQMARLYNVDSATVSRVVARHRQALMEYRDKKVMD